ncbi:MAG: Hsp20 family protein [Thermoplasmata archaeon]|nr:Hsp20 family protein [Thermoplasmata archaeon]
MKLQDIIERMEKEFEEIKQMIGIKKMPSCDIIEKEDELDVLIDLPGFSKKDVELEIGEDYVRVKASRKKREGCHKREELFILQKHFIAI